MYIHIIYTYVHYRSNVVVVMYYSKPILSHTDVFVKLMCTQCTCTNMHYINVPVLNSYNYILKSSQRYTLEHLGPM